MAVVAPYSGPVTSFGDSMLGGARLAATEINGAGGVDGYRIVLIAPDENNASTPADVVEDPSVVAVIGHVLSDGQSAAATYRRAGLVWLATEPVAGGNGIYPMVAAPATYEAALAAYLGSSQGGSNGSGVDEARACAAAAASGGGLVTSDGGALLCGGRPERAAVAMASPPPGGTLICVATWCDAPELASWAGGRAYDYVEPVDEPVNSVRWNAFVARTGAAASVRPAAALGYDGVDLVAAAFGRAVERGGMDRSSVASEVFKTRFPGLLGEYGPGGRQAADAVVRRESGVYPGPVVLRVED